MDHVCGGIARRGIKNASQTNEFPGRWQSGQSQQAVNLPPSGYGGSNPPLPTNLSRAVRARDGLCARGAKKVSGEGPPLCLSCGKRRFARCRGVG